MYKKKDRVWGQTTKDTQTSVDMIFFLLSTIFIACYVLIVIMSRSLNNLETLYYAITLFHDILHPNIDNVCVCVCVCVCVSQLPNRGSHLLCSVS